MEYPPSAAGAQAHPVASIPTHVLDVLATLEPPASAYLYDPSVAAANAVALRSALPPWVEVFYAVKANSFPPVVDALAGVVDGFEVASAAEARQVRDAAARAGRRFQAVASGPGKSAPLLCDLVEAGVTAINIESRLELQRVAAIGRARGFPVPVTIRVNPARVDICGALAMGGRATPFGIPEEDVRRALDHAEREPGVDVLGFHIHAVSGNLDAVAHLAYVRWCLEWSVATAGAAGVDLRLVDAGGGLGVAFGGGDPFDVATFAAGLHELRPPAGCRMVLEPGRWMVADCGWYAAEIVDLKYARGSWFAVVRGGINHFLLPASWDIVHRFAVVPADRWPTGVDRPEIGGELVTVVGELCTPEDVLARDVRVDRIRAGDVAVFPQAGSYGWEFAIQHFLQHPPPPRLVCSLPGDELGLPNA